MEIDSKKIQQFCNELNLEEIKNFPKPIQDIFLTFAKMKNKSSRKYLCDFILFYLSYKYIPKFSLQLKLHNDLNSIENFIVKKELKLKQELCETKNKIDNFIQLNPESNSVLYAKLTDLIDQFNFFRRRIKQSTKKMFISNAWLKMWEMIIDYHLIPTNTPNSNFNVFCNAEFPGSFIFAINNYIKEYTKLKLNWVANSLYPQEQEGNILGDEYGLYKNFRQNWLMDKINNGDVTSINVINYIEKKIGNTIDLYTSDIGIEMTKQTFNKQEEVETILNLGQIIAGLVSLKEGGTMVVKMFMFFTPFNISLLYLLSKFGFKELYISKPATSRPANSEIYIIGKQYKRTEFESNLSILKTYLSTWNEDYNRKCITPITEQFYCEIVKYSYLVYDRQINMLNENINCAYEYYNYLLKNKIPFQQMNVFNNVNNNSNLPYCNKIIKERINIVTKWKYNYLMNVKLISI